MVEKYAADCSKPKYVMSAPNRYVTTANRLPTSEMGTRSRSRRAKRVKSAAKSASSPDVMMA